MLISLKLELDLGKSFWISCKKKQWITSRRIGISWNISCWWLTVLGELKCYSTGISARGMEIDFDLLLTFVGLSSLKIHWSTITSRKSTHEHSLVTILLALVMTKKISYFFRNWNDVLYLSFCQKRSKKCKSCEKIFFWRKCIIFDETPIDRRFRKKC